MSVFTPSPSPKQPRPTDPAAVWKQSKRILFAVAKKVKLAIRSKLEGHGRGEAEPEELVNDAYICLMEALPRFNPATAKFTTFVYGLARRRMWLVARAAFYGLSPEQMHRMDVKKRTPRYHRGERTLRLTVAAKEDAEERQSVRQVDDLRRQLPRKDSRFLEMWLQENGNVSAVARRLHRKRNATQWRYTRLFRKIAATA
jgi:hypothetical protein